MSVDLLSERIRSVGFRDDQFWFDSVLRRGGIKTHWKIGQKNWVVMFEIEGDKMISAKVRTNNSLQERPDTAPEDIPVS